MMGIIQQWCMRERLIMILLNLIYIHHYTSHQNLMKSHLRETTNTLQLFIFHLNSLKLHMKSQTKSTSMPQLPTQLVPKYSGPKLHHTAHPQPTYQPHYLNTIGTPPLTHLLSPSTTLSSMNMKSTKPIQSTIKENWFS